MTTKPEIKLPELPPELCEKVRDSVAEALGDAMDCTRVWNAWNVGTMTQDDFAEIVEDESRLLEIVDAAIDPMKQYGTLCYEAGFAAGNALLAASQNEARAAEESLAKVVQQRNNYKGSADFMAEEIGKFLGVDFGDHRDGYCPWIPATEALSALKQSLAQSAQEPFQCPHCGEIDGTCTSYRGKYCDGKPPQDGALDAARYRRLRVLGCAPDSTQHLKNGQVMRFTNLDAFLDEDIAACDRGEFKDAQQPAQAAVPEGWKLVPVEPTNAMLDAFSGTKFTSLSPSKQAAEYEAYVKMLNAAPDRGEG